MSAALPIDPSIFQALERESRKRRSPLYLVGGPVRDALLNRPCHDWDLVGRQAEAQARAVSRRLNGRFIVLDEQNRIYRIILGASADPVTVDFAELQGRSIEEDLGRRDFTINAMAQPLGRDLVIDPFRGRRDLRDRIVRAVAERAFLDDPLRLLRAFRFSAQLGFTLEPRTAGWIRRHARLLANPRRVAVAHVPLVARERVREELLRLLAQPAAGAVVRTMDRAGLLTVIFPEMEPCRRVALAYYGRGGVLKHSLETVEQMEWILERLGPGPGRPEPSYFREPRVAEGLRHYASGTVGAFPRPAWLKLAGFLHDIGKPSTARRIGGRLRFFGHEDAGADLTRRLGEALRLSRQENQQVCQWVRHHMRLGNLAAGAVVTDKAAARYFRDLGEDALGMILVSLADHYSYLSRRQWGKGKDAVERTAQRLMESYFVRRERVVPARIVDGHDLMRALRLKPGPVIGKLLEAVADAQAEGIVHTKEDAIAAARRALKRLPRADRSRKPRIP